VYVRAVPWSFTVKSIDMVCENCDYYEPWETDGPVLMGYRRLHPYKEPWPLEINGSCRRNPPMMVATADQADPLPAYPLFPCVSRNHWCGEGRWTDPDTGERYLWGDWDE